MSLDPDATWRALFALMPPLAVAMLTASLHRPEQIRIVQSIVGLALAAALLGLMQRAAGPDTPLRWHSVTNTLDAVGPFANRNHLSTLLALALPLAAAQVIQSAPQFRFLTRRPHHVAGAAVGMFAIVMLLLAVALVRSRAGVVLAGLAVLGIAPMLWRLAPGRDSGRRHGSRRWVVVAAACGVLLAIQYGFWGLLQRFEADPMDDLRWTLTRNTLAAADHFGWAGVGLGGFVAAYQSVEPTSDLGSVLINRAHNDWAEWWLEGGIPLALIVGLGLVLFVWRAISAWHRSDEFALWQRGSAVAVGLVLLHGFSDYPLRTTAIACVVAALVAYLFARDHHDAPPARTRTLAHDES